MRTARCASAAAASLAILLSLINAFVQAAHNRHGRDQPIDLRHRRQSDTSGQNFEYAGPYSGTMPPEGQRDCSLPSSACPPLTSDMTRDASLFKDIMFDYIIMGAGNAGLVVANRLSEDPSAKVLVVEGGDDTRNDILVYKANETYALNNVPNGPHVYQYYTVPQINGTTKLEWYGKGLGGSTTVNGQVWDAPHKSQVDDIGKLGNEGWNWETLLKYYKKAQDYHAPSQELAQTFDIKFDPAVHSQGGPVTIAHLKQTFSGPPQVAYVKAVKALLGIQPGDLQSGNNNAVGFVPQTLYPDTDLRRVSSATSYYEPISGKRKNLNILLTWRVIKLNFDGDNATTKGGQPQKRAADQGTQISGITIQHKPGGPTMTLKAKRYILSAGSVASPYILEHSGIGDKAVLDKINVPQKVDLPGVGRMFSEQTQVGLNAFNKDRSWRGLGASSSIAQPTFQQLFGKNVSAMEKYVRDNLDQWAQQQVDVGAAVTKEAVLQQYNLMTDGIFKNSVPVNENFFGNGFYGNQSGLSMSVYTLTPYSKGYTHANSSDPWAVPEVNPRYYQTPFDMDIEVASLRAGKALFNTSELRSVISPTNYTDGKPSNSISTPECEACKVGSTEEYAFFRDHVISSFGILDHAVGTCSMMPQKLGGVVDSRFRVYGVGNLRIVDASVLPMQISAHPQATVYAIAEYASDLIKADDGLKNN